MEDLQMSVQVENLENNMAKLTIEVAADEVTKAIEKVYNKEKGRITIPGFRKGKAPRKIIEKMYGKEVFYEGAINDLIPSAYAKAADETDIEIVSQPKIDVTQFEEGKDFIFTAEVAVKPEVELGQYKGIEVTKVDVTVTEDEINAEIDKERAQNARTIDVTDRPVEMGDKTIIDFEGFIDGEPFEGGKGLDYPLEIGSHSFIDNFEDQLVGKNIGEEVEVNVTFPEEYHADNLAGKPAMFKVTVKKISTKELPELNDEFVDDVSEFDTVDKYKESIKEKLEEKKKQNADEVKEEEVIKKIIENSKMDLPEAMIDTQVTRMADDFARRLESQGLSIEQYFQYTGQTEEKFAEELKPQAIQRIQSRLVLEAIAAAENIEVTEEDFNKEVEDMAKAYSMEVEKVKEYLSDNDKESIMEDLKVKKAVALVKDSAVATLEPKSDEE